ncbi:MAG: hypothetical protein KJP15_04015, partial [Gammaproteobacteria bacterium]|nr:hypothetical protein [Gammaproteobacteria bacterium]
GPHHALAEVETARTAAAATTVKAFMINSSINSFNKIHARSARSFMRVWSAQDDCQYIRND